MPLPMMGQHPGTLVTIAASSIHGQINFTIGFHLDGTPDTQVHGGTIAREAMYLDAKEGDAVNLTFMMGNLIAISKR